MSCVQCVICTDLMHATSVLFFLQCGHVYHQECLNRWIRTAKTCPECRAELKTPPRRLFLDFTHKTDELVDGVAPENSLMASTIAKLEQHKIKQDRAIQLSMAHMKRMLEVNLRLKRSANERLTAERQSLGTVIETMRIEANTLKARSHEQQTRIGQMTETIDTLKKSQVDYIIENIQLKMASSEMSMRMDQLQTESVRTHNAAQQMKSENENLWNELTVQKAEQQKLIELNVDLKDKLQKTEEALMVCTNENAMMEVSHETMDTKHPQDCRNENVSLRSAIAVTSDGKDENENHLPYSLGDHTYTSRKGFAMNTAICDEDDDFSHVSDKPKRPKLAESRATPLPAIKIAMTKSSAGWTIVPRSA